MSRITTNKIQLCLTTFGVIVGIIGILHGCAELLRGATIVESHSAVALPENWPNTEFYTVMKGSPVFSLLTGIPYYVLGLLAITVSILLIVLAATFLKVDRIGISIFAVLNLGIFLFGAGEGTPIAVSLPIVIFGILSMVISKKKERSDSSKRFILSSFYFFYGLQIFSWVLFFPGLFVLSFYQEIPQALFLFDFMIMPISILGALTFGLLYDTTLNHQTAMNNV